MSWLRTQFFVMCDVFFFFQAEDGIRDLVRSRGLGDVYKRQPLSGCLRFLSFAVPDTLNMALLTRWLARAAPGHPIPVSYTHLTLPTIYSV